MVLYVTLFFGTERTFVSFDHIHDCSLLDATEGKEEAAPQERYDAALEIGFRDCNERVY